MTVGGIILRVDDVCRRPGDTPELGMDKDARYFLKWREAAGLKGLPVVYGVVPCWPNRKGLDLLGKELTGHELLAAHGWDHRHGADVTKDQMIRARSILSTEVYIPPFNKYEGYTIRNWTIVGGKYFFGGIYPTDHKHGVDPKRVEGCIHLPAYQLLYAHAGPLYDEAKTLIDRGLPQFPVVATLHVPWDTDFALVRKLVDLVRPYLVPLATVENWIGEKEDEDRRAVI